MAGLPTADVESWILVVEQARGDFQKLLTPAPDVHPPQISDPCSPLSRRKRKKPSTIHPSAPTPPLSYPEQGPLADLYSMDSQSDSSGPSQQKKRKTTGLSDTLSAARLSNYSLPQPASEKRENSPTRELMMRYKYANPPIKFRAHPDEGTPESVRQLLQTLPVLSKFGINVIPRALKEEFDHQNVLRQPPPYAWDAEPLQADDDGALRQLVRDIMQGALECLDEAAAEAQWQMLAGNFLEGAFKLKRASKMLKVRVTSGAELDRNLLPLVKNKPIQTRKPDLALALSKAHLEVGAAYDKFGEHDEAMRVSQYTDAELARMAFPACVEIGSPEKSYSEAALQIAVWASAGLRKLEQLRGHFVPDSTLEIPPLVMWTAIGTDWKLHIAYIDSRGKGFVCLGGFDCGGYQTDFSCFEAVSCILGVDRWAEERFWLFFKVISDSIATEE